MSLRDLGSEREPRHTQQHPSGFEPGYEVGPNGGSLTIVRPATEEVDAAVWAQAIEDFGLDPTTTDIDPDSVFIRAWDAPIAGGKQRMKYYRAKILPKRQLQARLDMDALIAEVKRYKPVKRKPPETAIDRTLVVCLSDWQTGKGEGGGTDVTVAHIMRQFDALEVKIKRAAKAGVPYSTVLLIGLGDLVEGCSDFYAMQKFSIDRDRRQQTTIVRRLIVTFVDRLIGTVERILLASVAGNHGENRSDGKAYTSWTDNDDLAVFEQAAEIFAANPERYASVSVVSKEILAQDDLTLTLDVSGIPVAFAHGHQFGSKSAEKWWEGQALGRRPVADAEILVSAHKHHFATSESTGRTWLQCPANDGGSIWWTNQTGQSSPRGMLTFGVSANGYGQRGWGDLEILEAS